MDSKLRKTIEEVIRHSYSGNCDPAIAFSNHSCRKAEHILHILAEGGYKVVPISTKGALVFDGHNFEYRRHNYEMGVQVNDDIEAFENEGGAVQGETSLA